MSINYEEKLKSIVKGQKLLINALAAVRSLDLPDWYIAGGAIRNTVWNVLHGYGGDLYIKDIDVAYFDSSDLKSDRENKSEKILNLFPDLIFEVINQARAHTLNTNRPEAKSSSDSIAYWSETATCVGVRLEKDDSLIVCAPYGLADLFELKVKPIPKPRRDLRLYQKRIREKQWNKTWPKLVVLNFT